MVIRNELILDAAAEVLARRPDATLQSIAAAAGVSRTTLFNKFATRESLLQALAVDTLERIGAVMAKVPATVDADPTLALTDITRSLMLLGPRTAFLYVAPVEGTSLDPHWVDAVTPLPVYFGQLQAHGHVRTDHPVRWLTASYVGLLFAAWDEVAEGKQEISRAAQLVVQTWLSGAVAVART